ncbi:MAG: GerMN domain-containing protein [Christensenellaceae bacterium]|nr:GerMN domain-containing protein [Christensenellaceae bacterium]
MRKLKAVFALILAGMMLCGCSVIREDNDITGIEMPETEYIETGTETRTITPSLYYMENGSKLGIETRELTLRQDDDEAEVIVKALLESPIRSDLTRPASGFTLDKVERTSELANVYLYAPGDFSQQRKFIISATVTNTLVDYFNIPYVCVFINNSPLLINGYPYGAMQKVSENIYEEYQQCLAKYESRSSTEIILPIYFLDETQDYIFPEMRTVTIGKGETEIEREELVCEILEEIAAGPKVNYFLKTVFAQKSSEHDKVSVLYDKNIETLTMSYNYVPALKGTIPDLVGCASVFRTLENIMPNMMRVVVKHGEESMGSSRAISRTLMGSSITLYFPGVEGNTLVPVSRTVYASEAHKYRTYIRELLQGPMDTEKERVSACFPEDYNTRDFKAIYIRGNTAYVDFGDDFVSAVKGMDEEREYLLFYSIVNTLCSIPRVKQVQFTINGQPAETAGGVICISHPLMPNPGLLK